MSLRNKPKSNKGTTMNVQSWVDIRYLAVIAKHKEKKYPALSELVREIIEEAALSCMKLGTKPVISLDEAHSILFPDESLYNTIKTPMETDLDKTLEETFSSIDLSKIKKDSIINLPKEEDLEEQYEKELEIEEKTIGTFSEEEKDKRTRILEIREEMEKLSKETSTPAIFRKLESLRSEQLELAKELGILG